MFLSSVAFLAAIFAAPALAEDTARKEPVRIERDQSAKAFVFVIDDEPVAILDRAGFHVRDLISAAAVRNKPEEFAERLEALKRGPGARKQREE